MTAPSPPRQHRAVASAARGGRSGGRPEAPSLLQIQRKGSRAAPPPLGTYDGLDWEGAHPKQQQAGPESSRSPQSGGAAAAQHTTAQHCSNRTGIKHIDNGLGVGGKLSVDSLTGGSEMVDKCDSNGGNNNGLVSDSESYGPSVLLVALFRRRELPTGCGAQLISTARFGLHADSPKTSLLRPHPPAATKTSLLDSSSLAPPPPRVLAGDPPRSSAATPEPPPPPPPLLRGHSGAAAAGSFFLPIDAAGLFARASSSPLPPLRRILAGSLPDLCRSSASVILKSQLPMSLQERAPLDDLANSKCHDIIKL
uniref:Uncharacterized protein n=1 Tax=Oryza glumipatula TaxID=40148 RepID=A0A0E0AZI6_9ORYZ